MQVKLSVCCRMPFEDFVFHFTDVSLTHLINTSLFSFSKTWKEFKVTSSWSKAGGRAGGCLNHPATFLSNPQLRFDLRSKEEVIIQLSQITDKTKVLARCVLQILNFVHFLLRQQL